MIGINSIFEYFDRMLNKTSLYKIIDNQFNIQLELINTIHELMKDAKGIGNSWIGWSKPNIKHFNTGKIIKYDNYRNYRLRNTARIPRDSYYRVRRKE